MEQEEAKNNLTESLMNIAKLGGRPPHYESPEQMVEKASAYFNDCIDNNQKPTVARLSIHLGFVNRQSFYDYENKEGFSDIIKALRALIESMHEQNLFNSGSTGSIFWLKQHAGYEDKQTIVNKNFNLSDVVKGFMEDEGTSPVEDQDQNTENE